MAALSFVRSLASILNQAVSSGVSTSKRNTEPAPLRVAGLRTRAGRRLLGPIRPGAFSLGALLLGGLAVCPLQAQTAYFAGTVTTLGGSFLYPEGVAVDASGNVYVAEVDRNAVKEMPAGCASPSCVTTLGGLFGFNGPDGVAVDGSGNVYVADHGNSAVEEMPAGCAFASCVTTLGGGFSYPFAVAVDGSGNVYVADDTSAVKEMPPGCTSTNYTNNLCTITTLGGGFSYPNGVAVDGSGNVYVADTYNNAVKEMPAGCTSANYTNNLCTITTLGGGFSYPNGVAVDGSGNVYVADGYANAVYMMPLGCASSSCVTTVGGGFSNPPSVAVDRSENVYVADYDNEAVKEIMLHGVNFGTVPVGSTGPVLTLYFGFSAAGSGITASALTQGATGLDFADAGTGTCDTNGTGHSYNAGDSCTVNVMLTPEFAGTRYGAAELSDAGGVIATALLYGTGSAPQLAFGPGIISTVAGNGTYGFSGDGGPATSAELERPFGVAVDSAGNLYIADDVNNRIRKVTPDGTITTVAGNGSCAIVVDYGCYSGDGGPATSAELSDPYGVAVDGAGNLYIAELTNHRVRKVTPGGTITTAAGTVYGYGGDGGPATSAEMYQPVGVAVDGAGNLYIADAEGARIRKVDASTGVISTVAGNGTAGYNGDNIAATSAELYQPYGVAVDGAGNLYIADQYNHRIRKVTPDGIIATVAGNGTLGTSGDGGAATSAELYYPESVTLDAAGNLYIADRGNPRIRKVTPDGFITTVAGNGIPGYSGDGGPATSAELYGPYGLAADRAGNLYIGDYNSRVRKVDVSDPPSLTFPNTIVGDASPAQDVALLNLGNAPLDVSQISVATNFSLGGADTSCSTAGQTLNAAESCILGIEFDPLSAASFDGSVVLTDNSLNVTNAVQSIGLSGTGTPPPLITPTITVTPAQSTITSAQPISVTVAVSGGNGNPTPTGSVVLSSGSYNSAPTTLTAGSATVVVTAGQLAVGSDTLTATYTPDGGSSSTYTTANGTAPETVVQAIGSCATANPNPNPNPVSFAAVGDFNGDCTSDLLWHNSATQQVYEWLMSGATFTGSGSPGTRTSDWVIQGTGDFDGDGKADILWRNTTTGVVEIWLINGTTASSTTLGSVTSDWVIQGVADFNGDGKADILWRNSTTGQVYLWFMNGTTVASSASVSYVSSDWVIAGIGDFNGDGNADILWRNSTTGQVYLWLMNGTTIVSTGTPGTPTSDWSIAGVGDFDGDGRSDILWRNTTTGQVYLWFMNGTTFTSSGSVTYVSSDWVIQGVGDYDGSGRAGILWRNSTTGQVYVWLMNGTTLASSGSPGTPDATWQIAP
jgi:large repetitive protein